jgi:hypothetical protein
MNANSVLINVLVVAAVRTNQDDFSHEGLVIHPRQNQRGSLRKPAPAGPAAEAL